MDNHTYTEIRKAALQNAFEHGGQTRSGTVMSRVLGANPELRSSIPEVHSIIDTVVKQVNAMTHKEQEDEIANNFPEILAPKHKEQREGLPELKDAERQKVVTRFPPEPNGYPHIGHAKAAIINSEYAKMYDGKFILRMDDTNPESERMEYHAAIKVGLEWLGIIPDIIKNTSDDMDIFYDKATQMIDCDTAYVCTCKRENITKNRRQRIACKCSMKDMQKNVKNWEKMHSKFKPGEAVMRFRGDMKSDNAVMRDPVLFRIIHSKHYTLGNKYAVWPSYDFAVAIEDSLDGVTHAFRSKEFELREELVSKILKSLNMRTPHQRFFSRLEFDGMPTSKRIIRPLIEEGLVSWYDDPRLPTLEGLKSRGIKPEAIKRFIMSLGLTKSNTLAPFDALEAFNRKIVDSQSIRLFMVNNPRELAVSGIDITSTSIPNHPAVADMGSRDITVAGGNFYISEDDVPSSPENSQSIVRLMGLGNVRITGKDGRVLVGEFIKDHNDPDDNNSTNNKNNDPNIPKIQWVPQKGAHVIKIIIPGLLFTKDEFNQDSLTEMDVCVEPHYLNIRDGSEIQFVRFGYCRKNSQKQSIFTHK